jgi:hypothetical protein
MENRQRTTYKLEPGNDGPENGPIAGFVLKRHDFTETRRNKREGWHFAIDQPSDLRNIAAFTRPELAKLMADAADWLAWLGD